MKQHLRLRTISRGDCRRGPSFYRGHRRGKSSKAGTAQAWPRGFRRPCLAARRRSDRLKRRTMPAAARVVGISLNSVGPNRITSAQNSVGSTEIVFETEASMAGNRFGPVRARPQHICLFGFPRHVPLRHRPSSGNLPVPQGRSTSGAEGPLGFRRLVHRHAGCSGPLCHPATASWPGRLSSVGGRAFVPQRRRGGADLCTAGEPRARGALRALAADPWRRWWTGDQPPGPSSCSNVVFSGPAGALVLLSTFP